MATTLAKHTEGRRLTPMLRQYIEAKEQCPDAILMFRMGDFFELFFEDAEVAAHELDIALTSRDKNDPIPMAGVPHHSVSNYIARLVQNGHTVAICDQVEDPKQAKGLVRREIVRLVTPGTVSDLDALEPGAAHYLACVVPEPHVDMSQAYAVAFLDMLAGELLCTRTAEAGLVDELSRMQAKEVLACASGDLLQNMRAALAQQGLTLALRSVDTKEWTPQVVSAFLNERFACDLLAGSPEGGTAAEKLAVASVVHFAESTQRRRLPHLIPPRAYAISDYVVLDESTRRNLEILQTQVDGRRHGSLLWHLDRCKTAVGSRMLAHWLLFPRKDKETIAQRQACVSVFKSDRRLREAAAAQLRDVRDIERLAGRIAVGRATPKDLAMLRNSLAAVPELREQLQGSASPLGELWSACDVLQDVAAELESALVADPPHSTNEGGIFQRGYRDDLDELIALSTEGHGFLTDLERREREATGIANLKVGYNRVFGYYIEVTKANASHVPTHYVRKQTLVGAERYITDELKGYEDKVLHADERRRALEQQVFGELISRLAGNIERLRRLSHALAQTDCLQALAQVADEGRYVCPVLVDEPILDIQGGRHPVVERIMPKGERFVPNDVHMSAAERQLLIITGPNMAGKSTVMRQVAQIALLAHVGSFVPAKHAVVGLCDRIFTRVGAADNLSRGQSTFMVEMIETAAILQHATQQSLVLLDEIGRGTSTFDGVSIAWAVAEYLHDKIGCRTMFATHYHELTDLAVERERIVNMSVAVKEQNDEVVFLRKLVEGGANRSYGIQVARLAGLPHTVLARAREILANLEAGELDERGMPTLGWSAQRQTAASASGQLALFAQGRPQVSAVEEALAKLDPMNMTPLAALAALDELKKLL